MSARGLEVEGLTLTFGTRRGLLRRRPRRDQTVAALRGLDVAAPAGALTAVLGRSGSGKSTLLRCVAGLEQPEAGSIRIDGQDVTDLAPGQRGVALAFQDLALLPHLDVRENLLFGLRARRVPAPERERRVDAVIEALQLGPLLHRRPPQLSGGEAQRVALGRAVLRSPRVLLLDEPFGALDAGLRADARRAVRDAQRRLAVTTLLVTHDPVEALSLADHLVVLEAGQVVQVGAPLEVHDHPATPEVARLIGAPPMSVVPGAAVGRADVALVGVRPGAVELVPVVEGFVGGTVQVVEPAGTALGVHVAVAGSLVLVIVDRGATVPAVGEVVGLRWPHDALWVFP